MDQSGTLPYRGEASSELLLIISKDELSHPDVVQRRLAIQLTEEAREKLENQGIPREQQGDDLTIMKARYSLDKRHTVYGVEMSQPGGEKLTKESVLKHIATFMNNNDSEGGKTSP